jgi:hypothetical protein
MNDDQSLVVRPRDYSNIAYLLDPTVLDDFLEEPHTFIADTIMGYLVVGNRGIMQSAGRVVLSIFKGQLFKQWAREFRALRNAGKIPDDFAEERKNGFQTWADLLATIDEESPDADRLEALKAMFYAMNKTTAEDKEWNLAHQLWRITKQLNSGDLLLLKTFCEKNHNFGDISHGQWLEQLTNISDLVDIELVQLHIARLVQHRLLVEPTGASTLKKAELSSLGRRLYENIRTYRNDLANATEKTTTE